MSCGSSNTTTATQSAPQQYSNAYSGLLGQAQQVAGTPYQQYPGQMVAGLSGNQQSAVDAASGFGTQASNDFAAATPSLQNAYNYLQSAQTPLWGNVQQFSPSAVAQYESPYTQQVVNATQAQFNNQNAQQQQQLTGNAIQQGAWGGDRASVAQGVLAGQQQTAQAPVIAGLENQGYTQALNEFNTQQQNQLGANEANAWLSSNAASQAAGLGAEYQNLGTGLLQNQLGTGQLQQQLAQANLNVPYEQYVAQQAYPFQTTGWLANIASMLGGAAGGSSSTTLPAPSGLSQGLGLATAGAGVLGSTGAFGSNGYLSGLFGSGGSTDGFSGAGSVGGQSWATPDLTSAASSAGSANSFGDPSAMSSDFWNMGGYGQGGAVSGVINTRARGGLIPRYASGGDVDSIASIPDVSVTWVPQSATRAGASFPHAPAGQTGQNGLSALTQALQAGQTIGNTVMGVPQPPSSTLAQQAAASSAISGYRRGGLIPRYADGGDVITIPLGFVPDPNTGMGNVGGLGSPGVGTGIMGVSAPNVGGISAGTSNVSPGISAAAGLPGASNTSSASPGGFSSPGMTTSVSGPNMMGNVGSMAGGLLGGMLGGVAGPLGSMAGGFAGKAGGSALGTYAGNLMGMGTQTNFAGTGTPGLTASPSFAADLMSAPNGPAPGSGVSMSSTDDLNSAAGYAGNGTESAAGMGDPGEAGVEAETADEASDAAAEGADPNSFAHGGLIAHKKTRRGGKARKTRGLVPKYADGGDTDAPTQAVANPWLALAAAGAGMAAGSSPFAAQNIGGGLLAGIQNLTQQKAAAAQQNLQGAQAANYGEEAAHQRLLNEGLKRIQESQLVFGLKPGAATMAASGMGGTGAAGGTGAVGGTGGMSSLPAYPGASAAGGGGDVSAGATPTGGAPPQSGGGGGGGGSAQPMQDPQQLFAMGQFYAANGQPETGVAMMNHAFELMGSDKYLGTDGAMHLRPGVTEADYAKAYAGAAGTGAGGLPSKEAASAYDTQQHVLETKLTTPYKILENLSIRAGTPVDIGGGRHVSGLDLLPPDARGAVQNQLRGLPGGAQSYQQGQPNGAPADPSQPAQPSAQPTGFRYFNPNDPLNAPALQSVPPQLRQLALSTAQREDVPLPVAVAVIKRESNWNPNVPTGAAGDTGLGQVIPGTGRDMLAGNYNLKDPGTNLTASFRYLHRQLNASGGSVPDALLGYNTGTPGRGSVGYIAPIASTIQGWQQQLGNGNAPGPRPIPSQGVGVAQPQPQPAPQQPPMAAQPALTAPPTSAPQQEYQPPPPSRNVVSVPISLPDLPPDAPLQAVRGPDGSIGVNPIAEASLNASKKQLAEIPDSITKLQDSRQLLTSLNDEIGRNAAAPGWFQSGAGSEWRTDVAKAVNGLMTAAGGQAIFSPAAIGNVEEFNKNSNVAAFQLARSMAGGRVALGEVVQANRSVPNMGNTPYGNVLVSHLLLQDNSRQLARLNYISAQGSNGVSSTRAQQVFDKVYPPSTFVTAAAAGAVTQAFPQVVAALKQSPSASNVREFDKRFGEGAGEFILSQAGGS